MFAARSVVMDRVGAGLGLGTEMAHETNTVVAVAFNLLVTVFVALRAFGPGDGTARRVQEGACT
jgi:hypothetical protein